MKSEEFYSALEFMRKTHEGQKRMNGDPFGFHCIRVCMTVAGLPFTGDLLGLRPKMIQIAILHDCIEDGKNPEKIMEEMQKLFGAFVVGVVKELTNDMTLPTAERRQKMVEQCGAKSLHAQIVKLADRLDNCSEMSSASEKFILRYLDETPKMLANMKAGCEAAPSLKERIEAVINPMIAARAARGRSEEIFGKKEG